MPAKRASPKANSDNVFGQARKPTKMFRAGLYARVSTNDQQTLRMQSCNSLIARLDRVRIISHNFGYGVGDDMDSLLANYVRD